MAVLEEEEEERRGEEGLEGLNRKHQSSICFLESIHTLCAAAALQRIREEPSSREVSRAKQRAAGGTHSSPAEETPK